MLAEVSDDVPPSGEDADLLRDQRVALILHATRLRDETRKTRGESKRIAARSVEDRICRQHQRTKSALGGATSSRRGTPARAKRPLLAAAGVDRAPPRWDTRS